MEDVRTYACSDVSDATVCRIGARLNADDKRRATILLVGAFAIGTPFLFLGTGGLERLDRWILFFLLGATGLWLFFIFLWRPRNGEKSTMNPPEKNSLPRGRRSSGNREGALRSIGREFFENYLPELLIGAVISGGCLLAYFLLS